MAQLPPQQIYANRFSTEQRAHKNRVWRVLCEEFLQRYIPEHGSVLDLGAGYGEFINHIVAAKKVALDLNPDTAGAVAPDVEVIAFDVNSGQPLPRAPYDVIFASNFFEHVRDKEALTTLVARAFEALRPGGRLLVMGPNIRFLRGQYWDFYDHHIPLSDRSVTELLTATGFAIEECVPRFLPYTMKSRLPSWSFLVSAYLKLSFAWRIFGAQFFIVARRG